MLKKGGTMHTIEERRTITNDPIAVRDAVAEIMSKIGTRLFEYVAFTQDINMVSVSMEYSGGDSDEIEIIFAVDIELFEDVLSKAGLEYIDSLPNKFEVEAEAVAKFCNWVYDEHKMGQASRREGDEAVPVVVDYDVSKGRDEPVAVH